MGGGVEFVVVVVGGVGVGENTMGRSADVAQVPGLVSLAMLLLLSLNTMAFASFQVGSGGGNDCFKLLSNFRLSALSGCVEVGANFC